MHRLADRVQSRPVERDAQDAFSGTIESQIRKCFVTVHPRSVADIKKWGIVGGLAVTAFVLSLVLGSWLFPHLSSNNDEPLYVLQAQLLRHGHLTLSAVSHDAFFRPWMSGENGGHLFLVVQPVLPALLAASDAVFGSMRVALGLIAAGAVIAVFNALRCLLKNDRVALIAAAFFALSPFVIVQSALFLTYVLAVLLTAVIITLVSYGLERGSRPYFAAAGLVYGLLLFTRPIEALMLVAALGVWMLARRETRRSLVPAVQWAAAGVLPVIGLMLLYNKFTTGNAIRFPLWAIGGNDSFGFGDRSIAPGAPTVHYGLSEAWLTLRTNLRSFPHWMLGGLVTIPLAIWGALCGWRRHRAATIFLGAIAVIFPVGYFLYWGNYLIIAGRNYFGPHYYMALLLPATAFIALGVDDVLRQRRALLFALVPLLVLGTAVELGDKIHLNERYRDFANGEVAAVRTAAHEPALVLLPAGPDGPYLLHPRGAFANGPDLSGSTIYAVDLLDRNVELFDRYPGRRMFRLQQYSDGVHLHPDVRPIDRQRVHTFAVDIATTAKPGEHFLAAYAGAANEFFVPCVLSRDAVAGQTYRATAHVTSTGVQLEGCEGGDVTSPLPSRDAALALGVSDTDGNDAATGVHVEQRYWLRSTGDEVEVITPADTWYRPLPTKPWFVTDPSFDANVRFGFSPGRQ